MVKRFWIQLLGTVLPNSYTKGLLTGAQIYQGPAKGACIPVLNCYSCPLAYTSCPIGALQHFMAIKSPPYLLLGTLFPIGVAVGRATCGWICPFGFLQDLLYKIKTPKIGLPGWTGYLKYLSLVLLVLVIPYLTTEPWFCKLCPQGMIEGGIPQVLLFPEIRHLVGWLYSVKGVILATFLILFILIKRPFCRMVCPLGAIFSFFNKISLLQITVDPEGCTKCGICRAVCPMDISIYEDPSSLECIRCMECVRVCPNVHITTLLSPTEKCSPQEGEG
ncbi:4Fe-4S binding protein [bacterium]|nr:4Fe-4S binding protein [bacterium]